jgi:hypothetical protein
MKTKRVVLQRFDAASHSWTAFFPSIDGESVTGQVGDSAKLAGKDASAYMPSKASALRVADEDNKPALLITGRAVVSTLTEDENKASDNDLFVKGDIYARDGQRVATMADMTNVESRMKNFKVNQAVEAERLATPVKINGVLFDGTSNIDVPFFTVAASAPADTSRLWIHSVDHTINYYDGTKWVAAVGVWG